MAVFAVGPATVRGQGAAGVVAAAQEFLSEVPLRSFAVDGVFVSPRARFRDGGPGAVVPETGAQLGSPRKCLNIFLRDAFYNSHLAPRFNLEVAKPFYELPLDGVVARALLRLAKPKMLPVWPGVKHLQPVTSEAYQAFALELSRKWKIDVYLDTYIWVENRGKLNP